MATKKSFNYIIVFCGLLLLWRCETVDKPMKINKESKTIQLLKTAYYEELNSSSFYRNSADKAFEEKNYEAGHILDELSLKDKVHASILKDNLQRLGFEVNNNLDSVHLQGINKSTFENLKFALTKQTTSLNFYHEALKIADNENYASIGTTFLWIHDNIKRHIDNLKTTLEAQDKANAISHNILSGE